MKNYSERLTYLASLPDSWDNQGAKKPSTLSVTLMSNLLSQIEEIPKFNLFLSPCDLYPSDGGIIAEWDFNNCSVSADTSDKGTYLHSVNRTNNDTIDEFFDSNDVPIEELGDEFINFLKSL